jgi:hypothetical protein
MEGLIAKLPPPTAESNEIKLVKAENDLRMTVIETGEALLGAKTEIVSGMRDVVKWLARQSGVDLESQTQKEADKKNAKSAAAFGKEYQSQFLKWWQDTAQTVPGQQLISELSEQNIGGVNGALMSLMGAGGGPTGMSTSAFAINRSSAIKLMNALKGLTPVQIGMLSGGEYGSKVQDILSGVGNKDATLQPEETASFYENFQPLLKSIIEKSTNMSSKTSAIGDVGALSKYAQLSPSESEISLQAGGRRGLQQILDQLTEWKEPQKKGLFKESDTKYAARLAKAEKLEDALTGLSTGQVEELIGSGKMGEAFAKGQLTTKNVDDLIKALKDNTAALNTPSTFMVQAK